MRASEVTVQTEVHLLPDVLALLATGILPEYSVRTWTLTDEKLQ